MRAYKRIRNLTTPRRRRTPPLGSGRRLGATLALSCAVACLTAHPASASAAGTQTAAAQTAVGTLPLLAALGFGILVAAGAVIAFLQMTTRGKGGRLEAGAEEGAGGESRAAETAWQADEDGEEPLAAAAEVEDEEELAERPLPDYTIPLHALAGEPEPAVEAAEGEPSLCGIAGEFAGICYRIGGRPLAIGRDAAQCGLVFPMDAGEVSRKHCSLRFRPEDRVFLLEDHGSSNGTFLADGSRLTPGQAYELKPGDRFSLSGTRHLFEVRH